MRKFSAVNNSRGVTLIELLIASMVLCIVIAASLQGYQYHIQLSETAKEKGVALNDARDIMEKILCIPFNQITADFPNGVADGGAVNDYAAICGGYTLVNERILVSYTNPAADPLEIIISVFWNGPRGRPLSLSLSTFKTE